MIDVSGESRNEPEKNDLEFNTLSVLNYEEMSVTDYDKDRTEKFGDYIIKKWLGVYRGQDWFVKVFNSLCTDGIIQMT